MLKNVVKIPGWNIDIRISILPNLLFLWFFEYRITEIQAKPISVLYRITEIQAKPISGIIPNYRNLS